MFILVDQIVHLLLEGVDNQVKLITLVNKLTNRGQTCSEFNLLTVELRSLLVTVSHGLDHSLVNVNQVTIFLGALILQNVDFIL